MTRFTFLTWDGGGNVPPAVGIAQELIARGNEVRFLGYLTQQAAIEARGLAFSALPRSGSFDLYGERAPEQRLPAIIRNVWACPEHLDDIPDALTAHPTDVLVVDFLMQGALAQARRTDIPVAVLAHSSVAGLVPPPDSPMGSARLAAANDFRATIGLPRMERLNDGWDGLPTIVTTIPELDAAEDGAPKTVHYVGPVAERTARSTWDPPWAPNDGRPLVLVSFSTTRLWDPASRTISRRTLRSRLGRPGLREAYVQRRATRLTSVRNRSGAPPFALTYSSPTPTACKHEPLLQVPRRSSRSQTKTLAPGWGV